ncbi:hypothetical protein AB0N29_07095 [Nocardioides sp. NPDC092400]|uniref:hypothetical protein n=1 Tax=Nocardioides sp. NPDC092400 TaxID=3155196 RepID=UPI003438975E
MSVDRAAEVRRVEAEYEFFRRRDVSVYAALIAGVAVSVAWRDRSPWNFLLVVAVAAFWEFTKYLLRPNARWLAVDPR